MTKNRMKIKDAVYKQRYAYNTHYHLIWCTKYRHPIFNDPTLKNALHEILYRVAIDNQIVIEKSEIMPDHVHLLISFPPSKAGSSVVKAFKGRSGFLLLEKFPELRQKHFWNGHLWTGSYYLSTVGNMSKETVEKYINDQIFNAQKKSTH